MNPLSLPTTPRQTLSQFYSAYFCHHYTKEGAFHVGKAEIQELLCLYMEAENVLINFFSLLQLLVVCILHSACLSDGR